MNGHYSMMAAENIRMIASVIAEEIMRPSAVYGAHLRRWSWPDERGVYWTAKYGDLEAEGKSPQEAMRAFDVAWLANESAGEKPYDIRRNGA